MYPALVLGQITRSSGFVVTLVTAIPHSFMLDLLVLGQMTLFSGFVVTLVTSISHTFMLGLLVCGQMTVMSIILIAHVAPEPAISLPDRWNCQMFPFLTYWLGLSVNILSLVGMIIG